MNREQNWQVVVISEGEPFALTEPTELEQARDLLVPAKQDYAGAFVCLLSEDSELVIAEPDGKMLISPLRTRSLDISDNGERLLCGDYVSIYNLPCLECAQKHRYPQTDCGKCQFGIPMVLHTCVNARNEWPMYPKYNSRTLS